VRVGPGIVLVACLASGAAARADDGGLDAPVDAGAPQPDADLSAPPRPLVPISPVYTDEANKAGVAGEVVLLITVDEAGQVTDVIVESGLPAGLTESAVAAARGARFTPARDRSGRAMPVRIRWIVRFTLPEVRKPATPATPAPTPPPPTPAVPSTPGVEHYATGANGVLAFQIRERGTGKPMPAATVWIEDTSDLLHVDAQGRVERALPPGAYAIVVRAPGHHQEEKIERLHAGERLERTYFVLRERLSEYETLILAKPPRAETGVVTLQADEIHTIPGTFGDPFRAVMLLPGVASVFSGLGYPVIRGEAPGQTGTFIDDVKVPLLYHLGFGPAVVHPLYLDSLDFHPGNFPAEFGRFTGGLIRAKTTAAPEERKTMLELDLFKGSAFHAQPFNVAGHEGAISAAARYGTLAFLARAFDPNAVLSYWDFQTRVDLRTAGGAWRLLIFGASDAAGEGGYTDEGGFAHAEQVLRTGFVRADLRYRLFRRGRWSGEAGVEVGPDFTTNSDPSADARLVEWVARPRATVEVGLGARLKLRGGVDTLLQTWRIQLLGTDLANFHFPSWGLTHGAFVQAEWQPTPAWLIAPGARVDVYGYHFSADSVFGDSRTYVSSVDPRLAVRRRLRADLYLKGGVGLYHSPPRFLLPWPGLEGFGLAENGLNESLQGSLGVEATLPWDLSIDGTIYASWLRRVSEFTFQELADMGPGGTSSQQEARKGRSYGLELIARRRLGHRLFGWAAYTLARSERDLGVYGWRPSDFDQTHLVNLVVSYALGRSWTISGVYHYNTGRPVTPPIPGPGRPTREQYDALYDTDRLPGFWRIDARIEKREAFDTWYLDFYVDWLNISLQNEVTSYDYIQDPTTGMLMHHPRRNGPLTIPTIGLRAEF
jgi:TonB family protein